MANLEPDLGGDVGRLEQLYRSMVLIRLAEEKLGELAKAGALPGSVHLYIGQEASGAGVCAHLDDRDSITSTHRGHGHYLAKGGDLAAMFAEIHGKASGICGGMGGSMHVADVSKGILGANGIVGGGIGIAAGAAWSAQLDQHSAVAVCFIGDGAANQGTLMEALNLAALWKLPLVIVCENNGWSEFSPTSTVTAGKLTDRAAAFGIPSHCVDGNDVTAVWSAAGALIAHARAGKGPAFLETLTYRLRGHAEGDLLFLGRPYRTEEEIQQWVARDPLLVAEARLTTLGMPADQFAKIRDELLAQVEAAVDAAERAPWPSPDSISSLMFSGQAA